MNNKELREKRRWLRQQNQKYQSGIFVEIPRDQWPPRQQSIPLTKVFRSREFLVQVFAGDITRLSISRTELDDLGRWKDSITWDELQTIKDNCGFSECDAVEAHPKKSDIVNKANMRHLWIVPPEHATFFWRGGVGSGLRLGNVAEEIVGVACLDEGCLERLEMQMPCDWCGTPLTPDNVVSVGREPSGPGATVVHQTCLEQRMKREGDAFKDGWRPVPPNIWNIWNGKTWKHVDVPPAT